MKKKILFIWLICIVFFIFSNCGSIAYGVGSAKAKADVKDEYFVSPDPSNPFIGTWLAPNSNFMHVIEGMNGTWYSRNTIGWQKQSVYTIEEKGDEYETSNHWRISVNGDIRLV